MHTKIADVLHKKGSNVQSIEIGKPIVDAVNSMEELGIGSVLVKEGDRVIGILTERDLARRCVRPGVDITTTPVEDAMTAPVAFVAPTTSIREALKVMSETHCRHLPVVDQRGVVGVVSLGDLLRWVTSEYKAHVSYLESYIRGY